MTWETVPLGTVSRYVRGVTFKPADVVDDATGVACLRTKNIQRVLDLSDLVYVNPEVRHRIEQRVQPNDVLISSANSWHLVGKAVRATEDAMGMLIGGFIGGLRFDPSQVDPAFGYRWFTSPAIQQRVRNFGQQTTNIANLNVDRTMRLPFPLPTLPEQRRIAAILDEADAVRERSAIRRTRLTEVVSARHRQLFAGAERAGTLANVLSRIESGVSPVCESRGAVDGEWAVLKLGAITTGAYLPTENKATTAGYVPRETLEVGVGDVLLSRKNTLEHVGASVYVTATPPRRLLPDLIFRLVPRDPALGRAIQAYLAVPSTRRALSNLAGGSASSMANISKARLMTLPVPDFSSSVVAQVEEVVEAGAAARAAAAATSEQCDALFESLQHRAFRGEL